MARLLTNKKSSFGSPYAYYTLDATVTARTPTSVKISASLKSKLASSQSYLGTGNGYGLVAGIYAGGEWHEWTVKGESTTWRGTATRSSSRTITVAAGVSTTSVSMKFRVRRTSGAGSAAQLNTISVGSLKTRSITAAYDDIALRASDVTQASGRIILSGLPGSAGYSRTIKWYRGSSYLGSTSISSSSTATAFGRNVTGLMPNTDYQMKAAVYYDSTKLAEKSVTMSTPQETGTLALYPESTYITAAVSGMFDGPNYSRTVEFACRKGGASDYIVFSNLDSSTEVIEEDITDLISNAPYDIRVAIKNGNTILKTMTASATTLLDTSLIPTGKIQNVSQKLGTRECTVTWISNKSVAGTIYRIQALTEGVWQDLATMGAVESPYVVTAPAGNADTSFRIASENIAVASGTTNYSNEYTLYIRDDFEWDSPKSAGEPMWITANEWNRLAEYAKAKLEDMGVSAGHTLVKSGDAITADIYNDMKRNIDAVNPVGVADKRPGDIITAADIDALRIAVNT